MTNTEKARRLIDSAQHEVQVAHAAVWHNSVEGLGGSGFGVLHDSKDPASATSALQRLQSTLVSIHWLLEGVE